MKKKKSPKLQLNRETLLNLTTPPEDLAKVQGGHSYLCTMSCNVFECPVIIT